MTSQGSSCTANPTDGAEPDQPPAARVIEFPESVLHVKVWPDPVLDALGHDPRSPYAERFWLAILGPSCLFLLRRIVNAFDQHPDGFDLTCTEWAGELGLGTKGGRHGPFWRAVERACRFGAAQRNGDILVVHRKLPPLTRRQIERLPDHLGRAHEQWVERQLERPTRSTITKWSNRPQQPPPVSGIPTSDGHSMGAGAA